MNTLAFIDASLTGLFAFAAINYAIHWWSSRSERVLLLVAVQCMVYAAFTWTSWQRHQATTIPDVQTLQDRLIALALLAYAVLLQLFAYLSNRRDRSFRALLLGMLAVLFVWNQLSPLRGTVIDLQRMPVPGGTALLPIRTPAGAGLVLLYIATQVVNAYGFVVARTIWKRDRLGAVLIALGATAIVASGVIAILIDFAKLRAPYTGALPHAFFVLCMALFLSREYSARAAREGVANRHFETGFEHAPIGIALLAPHGRVLRVNRALCHILGATAEELCTRQLQDLTGQDELASFTGEKCVLRKDGERVWVLLEVSVVPDDRGRPVSIIAQMQDVTELRAHRDRLEELVTTRTRELRDAKEDAEHANEGKSRFLAHISHEIRTPLNVILLTSQLIKRDPAAGDSQRKRVNLLLSSGNHLLSLLDDVLEMSKIEAGHEQLVEARFEPSAMLDEVEQMFAVQSASAGLELTIERSADLPRSLFADGGKVKQIVVNLVSNALKFTNHGAIRVKACARALADGTIRVEIVVVDSGIGIAAPDLERVFQPFEQLKAGAKAGGTGLGLAISRNHARLMRGDVTVESALGVGTTFTFTFLAQAVGLEPAADVSAAPLSVTTAAAQRKVLVVDDLEPNRDILAELLSQSNFEARTTPDGAGALAIDADWSPDLVLMDLRMPDMDGFEAIRRLRAAGSKAAIGVLTASALADDEQEALAIGADFFMRKPYDERVLFDRIARVLATRP